MNDYWQLKTTPIKDEKEDELSHDSIAELLEEKINHLFKQDNIPSCICLNGEYGSGKSTVINLLLNKWKGTTNKRVILFNIWRHKDENTYYALFRNIFYVLRNKNKKDFRTENFLSSLTENDEIINLDVDFTKLVYASFSHKEIDEEALHKGLDNFISNLPSYVGKLTGATIRIILLGSFFVSFFVFLIHLGINQQLTESFIFFGQVFFALIGSVTTLSFLFKNIFKSIPTLFKFHIQPAETTVNLPNISNTEQLQSIFRNMLHKYSKNEKERLIIIIEDVDRKHHDEIINTLNELRTFIDLGKAIFIIPCDLKNIEQAFIEVGISKSEEIDSTYIKWKAKDFYSKIFSHIITIPIQNEQDLRAFLIKKIDTETQNHPLKQYLKDNQTLSALVNVLLVNSIKTPREAINIFNRFTLQFEHALKLEKTNNRLKKGTVSNNVLSYARVYVLSTYYNLEKELLKYPELIDWILEKFRRISESDLNHNIMNEYPFAVFDHIPKYAQEYVKELYKNKIITSEIEEFISRTEIYSSNLIKPFIYLDELSYSGQVGNEIYNTVFNGLRARNSNQLQLLLKDDEKPISEVIQKVTQNINYDEDFKTILPTLIDIFNLINKNEQKSIADFILEHFEQFSPHTLYSFSTNSITTILDIGNKKDSNIAKAKYYQIFGKTNSMKECSDEQVSDISHSLINILSTNIKYIDKETHKLFNNFIANSLDDLDLEYKERDKYLETIISLDDKIITNLFDVRLLERFTLSIDKYQNNNNKDQLKEGLNKLISIFIKTENESVLKFINNLTGHVNEYLDNWFIELLEKYQNYFLEKDLALNTTKSLHLNIIEEYGKEDLYEKHKNLLKNTIIQFGQLDGYLFTKLNIKNTESFNELEKYYKTNITESESVNFLSFILNCIDIHESNTTEYTFYENLFESFLKGIKPNLWITKNEVEYKQAILIAKFLVQNNRIIDLKEEKQNLLRDSLIDELQLLINQYKANTENSETIYEFIQELNYAPEFKNILKNWIEDKNLIINVNNFSYFSDYFRVIELVIPFLSDDYLSQFTHSICLPLIKNNRSKLNFTEDVWKWIDIISDKNSTFSISNEIKNEAINYYSNHKDGIQKFYITKILSRCELNENENYVNILLESANEYDELIDLFKDKADIFNIEQQYECLSILSKYKKWDSLDDNIFLKSEELAKYIILEQEDSLIEEYYTRTKSELNWNSIVIESLTKIALNEDVSYLFRLESLSDELFSDIQIDDKIKIYIISLLEENFDKKLIVLKLIDKLKLDVKSDIELFNAINLHFVEQIDVNTEFDILSELKQWIKKQGLTRKFQINKKLKEIVDVSNDELKEKLYDLIKS